MALVLSKFLPVFILPLGLSLTVLALSLMCLWRPDIRRRNIGFLIIFSLLLLWAAGSPFFSDRLLLTLEGRYLSRTAAAYPPADAVVVLGGGVTGQQAQGRTVIPGRAFDRLYLGYRLYQSGKAPVIVLSGGGIAWRQEPGAAYEAEQMAVMLRQLGVPDKAFITECFSRNTRENAWYIREILRDKRNILLVTSAYHMPRAQACFERLGMTTIACPADFRIDPYKTTTVLDFLPDAGALDNTTIALREYMGMIYYRLRGWL
jgi:uncharacterized SAM-binding protein YcdF (DUF218 family)